MAATEADSFLNKKRSTAEVKSEIINKLFLEWCEQRLAEQLEELLYLDLFSGNGFIDESQAASPLLLVDDIYNKPEVDPELIKKVKLFFYDNSASALTKLKANLENLEYYVNLPCPPVIVNEEIRDQLQQEISKKPAFMCIDPFVNSSLQDLLTAGMESGSTDLVMLFNPAKVKTALQDDKNRCMLEMILENHLNDLKNFYSKESSIKKREQFLIKYLDAFFADKGYYTVSLQINFPDKDQTSQFLYCIFSKKQAYFNAKELLKTYSDLQEDGVPIFVANNKSEVPSIPGFFKSLNKYCIENLSEELLKQKAKYHYLTFGEIFREHSVGTNYVKVNYKRALKYLKDQGFISIVDATNKQVRSITDDSIIFYKLHGRNKNMSKS